MVCYGMCSLSVLVLTIKPKHNESANSVCPKAASAGANPPGVSSKKMPINLNQEVLISSLPLPFVGLCFVVTISPSFGSTVCPIVNPNSLS